MSGFRSGTHRGAHGPTGFVTASGLDDGDTPVRPAWPGHGTVADATVERP